MIDRFIQPEIEELLQILPAVFLAGARQSGKSTLIEALAQARGWPIFTFDDALTLSQAQQDPAGWLESLPKPLVLDEVQRVPELFLALKRDIDTHRHPGRFLLTGSASPLLLPRLGDSLADRMGILPLFPFSQGELEGKKEPFFPRALAEADLSHSFGALDDLPMRLLCGGFPPTHALGDPAQVKRWVGAYLQMLMDRDVRDLSNIEGIKDFPRLFRLLATRSGQIFNASDLSKSLGMVHMTLHRYCKLLETLYFVQFLPAWFSNLGKRLIKSPKFHVCDTALLTYLLDVDETRLRTQPELAGQFFETFVFTELLKQKSFSPEPYEIYHFRDGDVEVDFVLERPDGTLIGIEAKHSRTVHSDDARGLRYLQSLTGARFLKGFVLHLGNRSQRLGPNLWALPVQGLWRSKNQFL